MKRKQMLLLGICILTALACISVAAQLFVVAPIRLNSPAESGASSNTAVLGVLQYLTGTAIFAVMMGILAVMFIFPAAGLLMLLVHVVRYRSMNRRALVLPGVLILCSVVLWNIWSLFVYGPGYYFHHDFGSKVYNETYIIPHYETMYGDELELVDKEVIDSCNAVYTLRSGITGETFTAETGYYDVGGGVFDRLHLSADYGTVLGERLLSGEEISLPFNEGHGIRLDGKTYCWLRLWNWNDNYEIHISGDINYRQEFEGRIWGNQYLIKYEDEGLILRIPVGKSTFSTYQFQLSERHPSTITAK